jgi:hypothetical protein
MLITTVVESSLAFISIYLVSVLPILNPKYQRMWNEDEIPAHFEGSATCDDAFAKIHEQTHIEVKKIRIFSAAGRVAAG